MKNMIFESIIEIQLLQASPSPPLTLLLLLSLQLSICTYLVKWLLILDMFLLAGLAVNKVPATW